jgi:hypothetical protein
MNIDGRIKVLLLPANLFLAPFLNAFSTKAQKKDSVLARAVPLRMISAKPMMGGSSLIGAFAGTRLPTRTLMPSSSPGPFSC